MNTPQWIKYDGSDEQISDIQTSEHGWMTEDFITIDGSAPIHDLISVGDKYLICQPHPYADLIDIWRLSGCPVWYRHKLVIASGECGPFHLPFSYPDICEYSLTPFED